MFASYTTLTITESRFSRNVADSGGAMAVTAESSASIQSSIFGGNSAKGLGGAALRVTSSKVELLANSFTGNTAPNGGGGAILWDGEEAPIVRMACSKGWVPAPQTGPDGRTSCAPCFLGSYKDVVDAAECSVCDVGKYSATTGQSACTLCDPGTFQNMTASTHCVACIAGAESPTGSERCSCSAGFYGDGVSSCVECIANSHSASGSSRCICKDGFYGNGLTGCEPFVFADPFIKNLWDSIFPVHDNGCAPENVVLSQRPHTSKNGYTMIAGSDVEAGDNNCLSPREFEASFTYPRWFIENIMAACPAMLQFATNDCPAMLDSGFQVDFHQCPMITEEVCQEWRNNSFVNDCFNGFAVLWDSVYHPCQTGTPLS